jgi:hypothetical protein
MAETLFILVQIFGEKNADFRLTRNVFTILILSLRVRTIVKTHIISAQNSRENSVDFEQIRYVFFILIFLLLTCKLAKTHIILSQNIFTHIILAQT